MTLEERVYKSLKETSEILGCSDKTLRNYIADRRVDFQEVDSPYGRQYLIDLEGARNLYERKAHKVDRGVSGISRGSSGADISSLKDLTVTIEGLRADYKEAMEKVVKMSYELGNAQKEIHLLTGTTLEKSALEKQILELTREVERLKVENQFLKQDNTSQKPWWRLWG
jgi:hypothetical protein